MDPRAIHVSPLASVVSIFRALLTGTGTPVGRTALKSTI